MAIRLNSVARAVLGGLALGFALCFAALTGHAQVQQGANSPLPPGTIVGRPPNSSTTTSQAVPGPYSQIIYAADPPYNVLCDYNFGSATGTDNTTGIANAIAAAESSSAQGVGAILMMPAGNCLTGQQTITGQIVIEGVSSNATVFVEKSGINGPLFTIQVTGSNFPGSGYPFGELHFRHFRVTSVDGKGIHATESLAAGFSFSSTQAWAFACYIDHVTVYEMPGDGLDAVVVPGSYCQLSDFVTVNNGGNGRATTSTSDWISRDDQTYENGLDGWLSSGDSSLNIDNLNSFSNTNYGVHFYGTVGVTLYGHNEFNLNGACGLYLQSLTANARVIVGPELSVGSNSQTQSTTYGGICIAGGAYGANVLFEGVTLPQPYSINNNNAEIDNFQFSFNSAVQVKCLGCTFLAGSPLNPAVTNSPSQLFTQTATGTPAPNLLLNPSMMFDQANVAASTTVSNAGTVDHAIDAWDVVATSAASVLSAQQVTDAPTGFSNSLKVTVGTGSATVGTSDNMVIYQPVEAPMIQSAAFGTANALPVSLQGWVKSSVTGTFGLTLRNGAANRSYVTPIVVTTANTWQQIAVANIPGDIAGTWSTALNAIGLTAGITLEAGTTLQGTAGAWTASNLLSTSAQTQLTTTTGATFQVSGFKLEIGPYNTPFIQRDMATEMNALKRFYQKSYDLGSALGSTDGKGVSFFTVFSAVTTSSNLGQQLPVTMACDPTVTVYDANGGASAHIYQSNTGSITATIGFVGQNAFEINAASSTTNVGAQYRWQYTADCRL